MKQLTIETLADLMEKAMVKSGYKSDWIKDAGHLLPKHQPFLSLSEPDPNGVLKIIAEPHLSIRQHFAAKAMQGMMASEIEGSPWGLKELVERSFEIADAMLEVK